eukprot:TRINITY_DN1799_c0_g1_i2.p1 TRINITY_DN1799_c0_g1~~TRINITY_DN1799_c0_g1_i2.p1  ORF type:complete len:448 (-),score=42.97 TRINITY_DN1799_c0_g1_i2:184-1527(-)
MDKLGGNQGVDDEKRRIQDRCKSYVDAATKDFSVQFPHRLRWAHAVNSQQRLVNALHGEANFLEGDVSAGPYLTCPTEKDSSDAAHEATCIRNGNNEPIIMAHYPTQLASDLTLEQFVESVCQYNASLPDAGKQGLIREHETVFVSTDDEASAFSAELGKRLDAQAAQARPVGLGCAGARKRPCAANVSHGKSLKGVKLDFKDISCVEPTIRYLKEKNVIERLNGHLWLNADVLVGPGAMMTPLDAQKFVQLCAENLPDAVLSLGWGSTILSTTRLYTQDMIQQMIELCMCPIVKHSLLLSPSSKGEDRHHDKDDVCICLAAKCRHITFAVAADYALASADNLRKLLDCVPNASLTIYSGVGSSGVSLTSVKAFIKAFGKSRCFMDLQVAKTWRSWIMGTHSKGQAVHKSAPCKQSDRLQEAPTPAPKLDRHHWRAEGTLKGEISVM